MKLLFNNVILDSSISSTNESGNYPAENIAAAFLHQRYQATTTSDAITITLDATEDISSIWYSFTNATSVTINLYDNSSVLLKTIGPLTETNTAEHFTVVEDVKTITIELSSGSNVYLGGFAAGVPEELNNPVNSWSDDYIDNSTVSTSRTGQVLQNYTNPIMNFVWSIRENTLSEKNTLKDLYEIYGVGSRVWVDAFEDNHDFLEPFYAYLAAPFIFSKNGRRYDFELSITEAR